MQQLERLVPVLLAVTLILFSCVNHIYFDKDYYEKVTKIRFPDHYKVLQTFDNGEYLTGTVFQFDSAALRSFITQNNFDSVKRSDYIYLLSNAYFDTEHKLPYVNEIYKLIIPDHASLFMIQGNVDKVNWIYLADLATNRLWAQISYPDWGGQ